MAAAAERLYLDHNATAPLRPAARVAVLEALALCGNPSSVHAEGRAARRVVEAARAALRRLAGDDAAAVVFTASATEANNLILRGLPAAAVLVSGGEHPSVPGRAPGALLLPLAADGRLDAGALRRSLEALAAPALVAVQAAGRLPPALWSAPANSIALSSHKLGGPAGAGALLLRRQDDWTARLAPQLRGGGQEGRRRAGTEAVALLAGFAAAAAAAREELEAATPRLLDLRQRLEAGLARLVPETQVFGATAPRLANTTCFAVPGIRAETALIALDLAGAAVSSGSACSSGKVAASQVLAAMGVAPALAEGALRVSTGWNTQEATIERFLRLWEGVLGQHRTRAA